MEAEELSEGVISAARHLQTAADFEIIRLDNLTVLRPTQRLARLKPGKFKRESHDCEGCAHMGAFLLP